MTKPATILLVDDEPGVLDLLKDMLEPEGYHCLPAGNGEQGLEVLAHKPVDLVLSDLHMPGMEGIAFMQLVAKKWPHIMRVILSGVGVKDEIIEAVNQGHIHAYFTKPWKSDDLLQSVAALLQSKQQQEQETAETDKYIDLIKTERSMAMSLFEKLTETAPNAILMMDDHGCLTFWNRQAELMFGYQRNEILGKDMHALIAPERYKKRYEQGLNHYRYTGQGAIVGQTTRLTAINRTGNEFPIELSVNTLKLNNKWQALGIMQDITERVQAEQEKEGLLIDTIQAIGTTVEKRDPYTAGHQSRVAQLASAIAGKMALAAEVVKGIELGSMIHDIGKIYIPAEVLNRPGKLSDAEFEMIKSHPEVGYDIIRDINFPWPVAAIIRSHHERLDGSGYPDGLKGDEIIMEARIIAVADVVEAITSHRPYRPALGIDVALEEIQKHKGDFFNPEVVDACVKIITEDGFEFTTAQ